MGIMAKTIHAPMALGSFICTSRSSIDALLSHICRLAKLICDGRGALGPSRRIGGTSSYTHYICPDVKRTGDFGSYATLRRRRESRSRRLRPVYFPNRYICFFHVRCRPRLLRIAKVDHSACAARIHTRVLSRMVCLFRYFVLNCDHKVDIIPGCFQFLISPAPFSQWGKSRSHSLNAKGPRRMGSPCAKSIQSP